MTDDPDQLFDRIQTETEYDDPDREVKSAIALALEHRLQTGAPDSIRSVLEISAPSEVRYWVNVANELQARDLPYESLDCWQKVLSLANSKNLDELIQNELRQEMADSIRCAGIAIRDDFLMLEAAFVYELLGNWQAAASIRLRIDGPDDYLVLGLIRKEIEKAGSYIWDEAWPIESEHDIEFESIETMEGLESYEENLAEENDQKPPVTMKKSFTEEVSVSTWMEPGSVEQVAVTAQGKRVFRVAPGTILGTVVPVLAQGGFSDIDNKKEGN
jgi:hypothetical protein